MQTAHLRRRHGDNRRTRPPSPEPAAEFRARRFFAGRAPFASDRKLPSRRSGSGTGRRSAPPGSRTLDTSPSAPPRSGRSESAKSRREGAGVSSEPVPEARLCRRRGCVRAAAPETTAGTIATGEAEHPDLAAVLQVIFHIGAACLFEHPDLADGALIPRTGLKFRFLRSDTKTGAACRAEPDPTCGPSDRSPGNPRAKRRSPSHVRSNGPRTRPFDTGHRPVAAEKPHGRPRTGALRRRRHRMAPAPRSGARLQTTENQRSPRLSSR